MGDFVQVFSQKERIGENRNVVTRLKSEDIINLTNSE